jgi:hypothetical protein
LCVLLYAYVDWFALEVLEGEAEARGVGVSSVRVLEVREQALELVDYIVINLDYSAITVLMSHHVGLSAIISHEDSIPELRRHVELLNHGIHVAYAARVAYAHIALVGLDLTSRSEAELRTLWGLYEECLEALPEQGPVQRGFVGEYLQEQPVCEPP